MLATTKRYQFCTLLVSSLTLAALVIYSTIVFCQWLEMRNTTRAAIGAANAATRQADLMQKQLIATQAAVVTATPEIMGGPVKEGINRITLHIRDNSAAKASCFVARFNILKETLPNEKTIWESEEFEAGPYDLEVTPVGENRGPDPSNYLFNLSAEEIKLIKDMRMTIKVKGTVEYFNRFETSKPPFCFTYYLFIITDKNGFEVTRSDPQFLTCAEYSSQIDTWFRTKREWEQKEWQRKKPN